MFDHRKTNDTSDHYGEVQEGTDDYATLRSLKANQSSRSQVRGQITAQYRKSLGTKQVLFVADGRAIFYHSAFGARQQPLEPFDRIMSVESHPQKANYSLGIVQLLVGATMISFSPVFVKLADVGPSVAGFYRSFFGGIVLLGIVVFRRDALWRGPRPFLMAAACGVLFAADLSLWHRSINYIGPGLATIIGNFQVFFLAGFGFWVFRERVDWKFLLSVLFAVAGLFMLVGFDWNRLAGEYKLGVVLGIATAVTYAAYVLVLQRSQSEMPRLSAASNLAAISLVTAAIMAAESSYLGESFHIPDGRSWASMLAYGIICQALGWIAISRALVKVEASRAGLVLLLQPTLAFIWDVLFFARPTDATDAVGAALALSAIYLGSIRRRTG